ncbi:MAG: type II toxin-antitoxin system RelE/ParE family toxin [Treponema sp.]|nr:type II toxin-antitoxin system RelE/ParE family toxin [Treponema sp.]
MDKKYTIKWASPAKDDLDEIIEYISKTNITYAVNVMDKIYEQVNTLDIYPERCRIVPDLGKYGYLMYRELNVDYWKIIFKIENEIVYIMMIIDGRRNLEDILLKKMLFRENEI